jgi:hypothetical protein
MRQLQREMEARERWTAKKRIYKTQREGGQRRGPGEDEDEK